MASTAPIAVATSSNNDDAEDDDAVDTGHFGHAANTTRGYGSAIVLFDKMQTDRGAPILKELKPEHVAGTKLFRLLFKYAQRVSDGSFASGTASGYLGKVKEKLKSKFRQHADWSDESWYAKLRFNMIKDVERLALASKHPDDDEKRTLPLYIRANPDVWRQHIRDSVLDSQGGNYAIDGESLCHLLMKDYNDFPEYDFGRMQQRAWIVLTFAAVGRGGEVQLQEYNDWQWNSYFSNIDAKWSEEKTLKRHAMLFGPSKYTPTSYKCDVYHALASYFLVELGLFRGNIKDKDFWLCLFPQLQGGGKSCASRLSEVIQKYVLPELQKSFTSRSIRKAMTTFLFALVSECEMEYRGGWSNGSTSKFYKEDNIALSIPAMNAIGGWTDIKKNKLPPTLECLGSHAMDQVEAFIEALYMVDIDLFKRNGRLRPLLRACTASLLMYFDDVKRDHGVQATIVKQLIDAAIEANISEVGVSDPKAVLSAWGKTIKEKFIADNFESPLLPSNEQRMDWDHQVNHALVAQNQQLTDDKQHLCSEVADLRDDKKHLRSQVDHLEGKNERLEGENERLESERERLEGEIERLQNLVSSEPDKARVSLSPNRATVGSLPLLSTKAAAAASSTAVVGTQQLASAPAIAAATKKRAAPLNAFDMMTKRPAIHESAVSSSTESLAGVSISRLIAKLYETKGVFQGSKPNLQSRWHKPYKNQGKQEACLELADLVCTPQQWQLLCTPDCNRNQLGAMLIELEQASMTRLMHLEGKATCGASSYIQGVARRISAYKKAKLVSWLPRDVPTPPDASVTDAVVANDEESE